LLIKRSGGVFSGKQLNFYSAFKHNIKTGAVICKPHTSASLTIWAATEVKTNSPILSSIWVFYHFRYKNAWFSIVSRTSMGGDRILR